MLRIATSCFCLFLQIEREVTEAMMKSLKYCDLQTELARQPLYQYRAATIHHRLASMYHSCYRNQVGMSLLEGTLACTPTDHRRLTQHQVLTFWPAWQSSWVMGCLCVTGGQRTPEEAASKSGRAALQQGCLSVSQPQRRPLWAAPHPPREGGLYWVYYGRWALPHSQWCDVSRIWKT